MRFPALFPAGNSAVKLAENCHVMEATRMNRARSSNDKTVRGKPQLRHIL